MRPDRAAMALPSSKRARPPFPAIRPLTCNAAAHPRGNSCRAYLTLGSRTAHDEYMDLGRISVDHQIMGGVPCVTGTRIPVATVVGLVASGLTTDEIVAEYPQLIPADVQASLGYAARAVDERELPVRLTA
jgi:uncharacterized protein (DUF433 family)